MVKKIMGNPIPARVRLAFTRQNILRFLTIIFAFSAPLGYATAGLFFFILAFPFIYWKYKREDPSFSFLGQLMLPIVALIFSSYLSAFFGTDPKKSVLFTTGLVLMAVTGIAAGRVFVKDKKFFFALAMPLSLVATTLMGFVAIWQYFFLAPGRRATAFTGAPNRLGTLFLIFGLLGVVFLFDRVKKHRWVLIPYGLIILLAMGTTLSRAAWVGAVGGLFLFSFYKKFSKKPLLVILIIFVLAGTFFFLQPKWYNRFLSIFDLEENMIRIDLWHAAYHIFQDHPLTGTGLGNFPGLLPDYAGNSIKTTQPTPHNFFFNILSDMGLVGFAAFLWLMCKVSAMAFFLWRYGDLFEAGVVITLAAFFINELFTHNLYTSQVGAIIWFLLGALSMFVQERKLQPVP
ncbi:MAG TPA: O-antigen ligase family protein [Firmicutes bacterium]|jgi:O-antigen ligase|nr:O-antigen ligase family protein [Bacillota bacterium]